MKQILREPLVHFLLLGAGLFMAYSLMAQPGSGGAPRKIVITHGQIENLAAGFARAWQRPPTTEEMSGLVRDLVREEVYCREAMAMGLEKDDTVIRRRLRQKMEFISDDIAALAEPTDADLNAYLQAHPDTFRVPQRYTRQWQGPVKSGYGVHLVLVSERTEGHLPALAEVRDAVRREWTNSRRLEANDKFYQELLKRYSVTIEGVEPTTEPKKVAATMAK